MKKTLQLVLVGVLVFPAMVSAASWWNPFTWSWDETNQVGNIEENTVGADLPSSKITETPTVAPQETTPIIKVETKYVDNPALSLQVQELIKENEALNQQVVQIQKDNTNRIKELTVGLNQCKSVATQGAPVSSKSQKLEEIDNEMDAAMSMVFRLEESFGTVESIPPSYTIPSLNDINTLIDAYKVVDPSFSASKITSTNINKMGSFVNYLRTYRKYRNI